MVARPAQGILFFAHFVARTHAEVPDDEVLRVEAELVVFQADAVAGGGLTSDGDERMLNLEF